MSNIQTKVMTTKEKLFALEKNFTLITSGAKYVFQYYNGSKKNKLHEIVFTDYSKNAYLSIIKKVKDDLIDAYYKVIEIESLNDFFWSICGTDFYTKFEKPQNIEKKKISYIGFNNYKNLDNTPVVEIDVNSAYLAVAKKLGYLSEKTYSLIKSKRDNLQSLIDAGIEVEKNEELKSQLKYAALMGIGAVGKCVRYDYHEFKDGKHTVKYYTQTACSHIIMLHIHYEMGEIMKRVLHYGYFFWVDAIVAPPENKQIILDFFENENLEVKEKDFFANFAGDKITLHNEGKKKDFFLTKEFSNKINNYF